MVERRPRRRAEETREDILCAADQLFRQRGFAAIAIADIAAALKMSPANIFKHFHSKTALADAITERHVEMMIGRLSQIDSPAPAPERLATFARQLMEAHLADFRNNPYLFELVCMMTDRDLASGQQYKALIEQMFCALIRQGVESGFYHCSDPDRTGKSVASAFASVLHPVFLLRLEEPELRERCAGVADLVNAALQNPLAR